MPRSSLPLAFSAFLLAGCAGDDFDVTVANQGPTGSGLGGFMYLRSSNGDPIQSTDDDTVVEVETRRGDGQWREAEWVTVEHVTPPLVDVVMVADNSGSERDYEEEIQGAVDHFAHTILVRQPQDRMGLVRVSTQSEVLQPLTTSEDEMRAAVATLYVNRGWTALWDGVRLANETLAADALQTGDTGGLCMDRAFRTIIVFTDGQDNNSSDEQETSYEGDGVDTTLDDLLGLNVYGAQTPVHTVAVGNEVDYDALRDLSDATGGQRKAIQNFMGLEGALRGTAAQLEYHTPFCFEPASCADTEAKVIVKREVRRNVWETREFEMSIPATCID